MNVIECKNCKALNYQTSHKCHNCKVELYEGITITDFMTNPEKSNYYGAVAFYNQRKRKREARMKKSIYEEDYLLLDEVLDLIESIEYDGDIKQQEKDYNATVDIYKELEITLKLKKQTKLLELYKEKDKLKDFFAMGSIRAEKYKKIEKQIKELENESIT